MLKKLMDLLKRTFGENLAHELVAETIVEGGRAAGTSLFKSLKIKEKLETTHSDYKERLDRRGELDTIIGLMEQEAQKRLRAFHMSLKDPTDRDKFELGLILKMRTLREDLEELDHPPSYRQVRNEVVKAFNRLAESDESLEHGYEVLTKNADGYFADMAEKAWKAAETQLNSVSDGINSFTNGQRERRIAASRAKEETKAERRAQKQARKTARAQQKEERWAEKDQRKLEKKEARARGRAHKKQQKEQRRREKEERARQRAEDRRTRRADKQREKAERQRMKAEAQARAKKAKAEARVYAAQAEAEQARAYAEEAKARAEEERRRAEEARARAEKERQKASNL